MSFSAAEYAIGLAIIITATIGFSFRKIDAIGTFAGIILAYVLWIGGGVESLFALFIFFTLGSLASSYGKNVKKQLKLEQENSGKRGISNVLANGGVAGGLAIFALVFPELKGTLTMMIVASFATACSDTFSSEFGNIYGKRFFQSTNLKPSQRGLDGVISLEGILLGIVGSGIVASSLVFFQNDMVIVLIISICGIAGNLTDSFLGATLQQKGYLNNHQVNFWATLSGALLAFIFISFS